MREYKHISIYQLGFTPGDCTKNQLVSKYHEVCTALENENDTQLIFLDISKVFDKVWHKGLIFKLESVGIKHQLLQWFKDYLDSRKQRVIINGNILHGKMSLLVYHRVQFLLFLIYINDITTNISCKTTLYADDTSISKHVTDPITSNNELQHDLTTIEAWADKWKIKFNPVKSEALLITRGVNRADSIFIFQNHIVNNVNEHTHLGLTWNKDGTWKNHLSPMINKATKRVDMMRALKYKLSRSALEKIYFAFIRPLFEYGCVVWDNASRHDFLFNEMEKKSNSSC